MNLKIKVQLLILLLTILVLPIINSCFQKSNTTQQNKQKVKQFIGKPKESKKVNKQDFTQPINESRNQQSLKTSKNTQKGITHHKMLKMKSKKPIAKGN